MLSNSVDACADRSGKVSRVLLIASLAVFAVASAVFLTLPQIDLWVAGALYSPGWDAAQPRGAWLLTGLRFSLLALFWSGAAAAVAGTLISLIRKADWLGLNAGRWLFICVCLVVGPGLVANSLLKDNWGRARPRQVIEFGGSKTFSPPLLPTNQCERNCSFVSGEASAMFAPFYAAALVLPQSSVLLLAVGTLAGSAAGLVRMTQGAHFLSDVLFAGILMALTAALLHRLMFGWPLPRLLQAAGKRERLPAS